MTKLKTLLLGIALALPLATFGNAGRVEALEALEAVDVGAAPAGIEVGAQQQYKCCWVFMMGMWYCIAC